MTPEEYGRCASTQMIADLESVLFDKQSGRFVVPVYMLPEEYGCYAQSGLLPNRLTKY